MAEAPAATTMAATLKADSSMQSTMPMANQGASERDKDVQLMFGAVEAQWILTVLDDASNKLSLTSYLTPEILNDSIMDAIDHEMGVALKEHFEVEKQYIELLEETNEQTGGGELQVDDQTTQMLKELDLCLSDSTRTVARLLKMNPLLVRRLREVCSKRKASSLEFINTFARLRKLIHNKLRMSAEEERAMKEQLEKLQEEEEEDTKRMLELTEGLAVERSEHKQVLAAKDRKIMRLRKQIEQITLKTSQERKAFQEKMDREREEGDTEHKSTKTALGNKLASASKKLETDGQGHWLEELSFHRKKYNASKAVEELIKSYDTDMIEKHTTKKDLEKLYKEEKEEMATLTEYFEKVDMEIKRQEEEIAILTVTRDKELVKERKRHEAAILFQKLFRGFTIRNASSKKPKAEKGDKKKK